MIILYWICSGHEPEIFVKKDGDMQTLCARDITLSEITQNDLPILHAWRNSDHFVTLCSTRRNTVDFDQFKQELMSDFKKDRHIQCLITKTGEPIGTIYSYGLNKTDGHVYTTIYLAVDNERRGHGAIAFALFAKYLFESFELYKIYSDAYSYNTQSLRVMRSAGFIEEGVFKGHRRVGGARYDLVRMAFFRETLPELQAFVARLTTKNQRYNLELGFNPERG